MKEDFFYANQFGVLVTGVDLELEFQATWKYDSAEGNGKRRQMIIMSYEIALNLAHALLEAIESFERSYGRKIVEPKGMTHEAHALNNVTGEKMDLTNKEEMGKALRNIKKMLGMSEPGDEPGEPEEGTPD